MSIKRQRQPLNRQNHPVDQVPFFRPQEPKLNEPDKDPAGQSTRSDSSEARSFFMPQPTIQMKSSANSASDPSEQEADRVAEAVVGTYGSIQNSAQTGDQEEQQMNPLLDGTAIQQKVPSAGTIQRQEAEVQEETPSPRIELGRKILQSMSQGLSIIFYEIDDPKFHGDAQAWAKTHGAIGLKGNQITAENVEFGKAIPERIEVKGIDDKKRTLSISQVINEFGALVEACVREAFLADNGYEIDAGTLNLAKFKTVALGSHGWDGGTSLDIDNSNVADFLTSISPFLRNDINVVFYACTVSKSQDEDYDQWMKVYNEDGGEDSLTAKARDQLAALGKTEGVVWGHTAVGHFLTNYTLRRFKVSDVGKEGESFLLYCFQDEINSIVADIVDVLQADPAYTKTVDEAKILEIWDFVYAKTKEDFRSCYSSANSKVKLSVGGNDKHLAEEAPMYPEEVKAAILEYRSSSWTKKFKRETVITQVVTKVKAQK